LLLSNLALAALAAFLLPMSATSGRADVDGQVVKLQRWVNGEKNYFIHPVGAGSKFQSISPAKSKEMFCPSKLPDLCQIEFAAVGLYDADYRRFWVMKGVDDKGVSQLYLDSDGDNCFTDERPLKTKNKTAKYHLEDSPEWVMSKYVKSETEVRYHHSVNGKIQTGNFAIHLVYVPEKNFLEFDSNEFWLGEARFGKQSYPIALYGGLMAGWYLRATFDETNDLSHNEIRVDLNRNGVFEDMTVFDPTTETVVQERYLVSEPFVVDGHYYKVDSISRNGDHLVVKILPQPTSELSKLNG